MFSSGSEGESYPRRELSRGLSMVTSVLGDEEGAVGPVLSPVRRAALMASSQMSAPSIAVITTNLPLAAPSSLGSNDHIGAADVQLTTPSSPHARTGTGFRNKEPPKSIPDTEARRSKARSHSKRTSAAAVVGLDPEQDERFLVGNHNDYERRERLDQSAPGSRRGPLRRRSSSGEDLSSSGRRRPHAPTPRHVPLAEGGGWDDSEDLEELDDSENDASNPSREGVAPTPHFSDLSSSYVSGSVPTVSDFNSREAPLSSDYSSRGPLASAYDDSVFDSASTWAGASAVSSLGSNNLSVFKTPGRDSVLDTSPPMDAVSEHISGPSPAANGHGNSGNGGTSLASAGRWMQTAAGWAKVSSTDQTGGSVNSGNNGRHGSPSQLRGPNGTAPLRGSQRRNLDKLQSSQSSIGGAPVYPVMKPKHLPRPLSTPRRAAMSPHGAAMDAALRMIEDGGVRLGIVREETVDEKGSQGLPYDNQIAAPKMTSLEQRRQRAKAWAKSRAGGDSHRIRTGAMPTLDEHGNEVRIEKVKKDLSSSGSESEITSSTGVTPARSRASSRSSFGTTPARSRSSRSGTRGSGPPLRGTARTRGGASVSRASPPPGNSTGGDSKAHRRTGSDDRNARRGSGEPPAIGRRRTVPTVGGKVPHLGVPVQSKGGVAPQGGREQLQTLGDALNKKNGQAGVTRHNHIAKSTPNVLMPNMMAGLLVAPLSRPIPTDSVNYLYGGAQDGEHCRSRSPSRSRSRSATPELELSPPPPHHAHVPKPQRPARGEWDKLGAKRQGPPPRSHQYTPSQSPTQEREYTNDGPRKSPPSTPIQDTIRTRSTHGKQQNVKVTKNRRSSSGQQSEEDALALSRSHREALRSQLNGATALPVTSKSKRSPLENGSGLDSSFRGNNSGGTEQAPRRTSGSKDQDTGVETYDGDGWGWTANDMVMPTKHKQADVPAWRGHEEGGSAGIMMSTDENRRIDGSSGSSSGIEAIARARPTVQSAFTAAVEKTRAAERDESNVILNSSKAAADWERKAAAEADMAAETSAAVVRAQRAAEVKAVEAAAALKAREEAEAKALQAAKALDVAKAAAAAMTRASPAAATAASTAHAAATATAAATAAQTVAATAHATVAATNAASAAIDARSTTTSSTVTVGGGFVVEVPAVSVAERIARAEKLRGDARPEKQRTGPRAESHADRAYCRPEAGVPALMEVKLAAVRPELDAEPAVVTADAAKQEVNLAQRELVVATAYTNDGVADDARRQPDSDLIKKSQSAVPPVSQVDAEQEFGFAAMAAAAAAQIKAARAARQSDDERSERSQSAEMLTDDEEDDDERYAADGEEAPQEENGALQGTGGVEASEGVYSEQRLPSQDALTSHEETRDGPREFAMHEAVYDDDIDLLGLLLDHALAAQEEEEEAINNGELLPEKLEKDPFASNAGSTLGQESLELARTVARKGPGGMDEVDHHGNTPLLLALQLGRLECANALLEAGANVDIKSGRRYHLMDEAVLTGDQAIVRQVYMRAQQLTWLRWRSRLPHLLDVLENIPDFYVEMKWNFTGAFLMGPLMQAVAPSDTYKIWKRGSWLRVDSTIVGVGARFKLQRGRLSLVFMGKDSETPGVLLRVDHTKSKVYNALRRLEWQTNREVDKAVHNLMASSNKGGVDSTQFKAKKTVFRQAERTEGGQTVQVAVDGFRCSTYQYLGSMQMRTIRKGGNVVQYVPKHYYFDQESEKSLQKKAEEAIAQQEEQGHAGGMAGSRKSVSGASSMFPRPFWKSSQDLNQEKVHRQINKQVKATVWMAHDYPLKLKHIMPALEILSVRDDMAARLRSVLSLAGIPQEGFPVKVSVPLMMTVKAVVTFENFRAGTVDKTNFIVPPEYKRSRRMSKELYIAGVSGTAAGGAIGGDGGGGQAGAFETDDDDDDEDVVEDDHEDEGVNGEARGELSDREIMRRRAAHGDGFDDDEEDEDTDFDDDFSDQDTQSLQTGARAVPTQRRSSLESRQSQSPRRRGRSPARRSPEMKATGDATTSSATKERRTAASAWTGTSTESSDNAGRGRAAQNYASSGSGNGGSKSGRHTRGRSMGASLSMRNMVSDEKTRSGRSKSRSRRLVSQLKDMVGGKHKRRGSMNRGGSFSDEEDEDSYEDSDLDGAAGGGQDGGGGGTLTIASQAAALPDKRGHRRVSSASASLGGSPLAAAVAAAQASSGVQKQHQKQTATSGNIYRPLAASQLQQHQQQQKISSLSYHRKSLLAPVPSGPSFIASVYLRAGEPPPAGGGAPHAAAQTDAFPVPAPAPAGGGRKSPSALPPVPVAPLIGIQGDALQRSRLQAAAPAARSAAAPAPRNSE